MADNSIPNDLQPVPDDLEATPGQPSYVKGARDKFRQDILSNPVQSFVEKYLTPSPATALSAVIPGGGLLPALFRIGATGGASAGEAYLDDKDPLKAGLTTGGIQGAMESVPMLPAAAKAASWAVPGVGKARAAAAMERNTKALTDLLAGKQAQAAQAPGEYMGKYIPTGIPASKVLGPSGQPMRPAVDPQIIPHKDLSGWTLGDVLNQSGPKQAAPGGASALQMLLHLLKAGGQEAADRNLP